MDMPQSKPDTPPNAWQLCHVDLPLQPYRMNAEGLQTIGMGATFKYACLNNCVCVCENRATRKMMGLLLASL